MPWPAYGVDAVEANRQFLRDVQDVLTFLVRRAAPLEQENLNRVHRVAVELERHVGPPSPFGADPLARGK